MKTPKLPHLNWIAGSLALALAFILSATTAHANVYATDIQINGNLTNALAPSGRPLSISYRLNQGADLGVTVNILNGNTTVASIAGGTNMGLNSVSWTPAQTGTYSVSITAAATGFPVWTQISIDSNPGMPAYYPIGIAVDNNTNSPYYGRVVMGCALTGGTATSVPLAAQKDGLFKMNADGSQADEGWYGNANYLADDGGDGAIAGEFAASGGYDPMKIRIGDDDRIYWVDNTDLGAVVASDILATTNQVVICEGAGNKGAKDVGPSYFGSPMAAVMSAGGVGFQEFDVTGTGTPSTATGNAAVWICDNDFPNSGIWMFHMVGAVGSMAVDTNDIEGTQAVQTGYDLNLASSGGCMIDTNLDIFCGEDRNNENAVYDSMLFSGWPTNFANTGSPGVLPPENSGTAWAAGYAANQVTWGYGCGLDTTCATDPTTEGYRDVVINSRINPTMVAMPSTAGSQATTGNGIRVLNATTGALLTSTNIDTGHQYACAAWDNVGNLYGGSTSRNLWRVWSPPGSSTNTTMAVAQVSVQAPLSITGITSAPTTPGCATVTLTFTAPSLPASAFVVKGSATVTGLYTAVPDATISGSSGSYTATFPNCSTEYYLVEAYFPALVQIQNGCFTANASLFKSYPGYLAGGAPPTNNPTSIPGWTASGNQSGVNGLAVTFASSPFGPTTNTDYTYAFIQADGGTLKQNLPLVPNTTYTLSFAAAGRKSDTSYFGVQIGDATQVYVNTGRLAASTTAFAQYSYTFTTPASIAGTPSIQLQNLVTSGDNTVCFSEVSLVTVAP